MKVSKFTKQLSVTGMNRKVKGEIVVTMNHDSIIVVGTGGGGRDESQQTLIHKVEGFIDGKIYWKNLGVKSESEVLFEVERCEKDMRSTMNEWANAEPIKTFANKMKDLGFGN